MKNFNQINMRILFVLFIIIQVLPLSCGKLDGEFAFKTFGDDHYKRINKKLEFGKNKKIDWIYKFKSFSSKKIKIGVILLKKELVWVDIYKRFDSIGLEKNIIYGSINNLNPGNYRIVLTVIEENNKLVASRDFTIYSDNVSDYDGK